MNRNILIVLILFYSIHCNANNVFFPQQVHDTICKDAIYIKTDNYEGVIFGKYCPENIIDDKTYRWSPTKEDIEYVEILIKKYIIKQVKKRGLQNQYGDRPIIHLNFDKYIRQYMGYINKRGEKIIDVNCFWKSYQNKFPYWKRIRIEVMDGGSYYWSIKVNINKKKCFNYMVNN
ncbi:MAG TPA: hypothetical protein PLF32_09005 [Bacteroidales bacterium]|nr:hypothetical protein [Bacteroidales bacterium]HOR82776.1 hypothetical protein [Bacteroidales bacterium]HPJ92028.1 hypothetical protein [Bacteroidales bacterium]